MFEKSAEFYDLIYRWKDYAAEAERVRQYIRQYGQSGGSALLDVACGTGGHIAYLRDHYQVEGLDVARSRFEDVPLHQGDMRDFDLGKRFDAIVCLFSAIAYTRTVAGLHQALTCFARHLKPGGVVLAEGFIEPDKWQSRHVGALFVDEPELKIARMNTGQVVDQVAVLQFHYLVGTPDEIRYFTEQHELALFSDDQYLEAFRSAGLEATQVENGLMKDRSLFVGVRPPD